MKKIVCLVAVLVLFASTSFAAEMYAHLTSTTASSGVSGNYFANNAAGNDATMFQISTGHNQGTQAYATGNFVSDIYMKDNASDKFASTDLLTTELTYSSVAFDTDWTAR